MAFEAIETKRMHGVPPSADGVTVALYSGDNPQISFRFGAKILKKLGWPEDSRVSIAEGTGADAGLLQLTLTKAGLKMTKAAVKMNTKHLRHHKVPGEATHHAEAVVIQTFGSALTIMMPAWFMHTDGPAIIAPATPR